MTNGPKNTFSSWLMTNDLFGVLYSCDNDEKYNLELLNSILNSNFKGTDQIVSKTNVLRSSFAVCELIAKYFKCYSDGEFVKDCLEATATLISQKYYQK
jgi:hypothetical protein